VEHETRRWIEQEGRTAVMRRKEQEHDYRYFPDPDLPPLVLEPGRVEKIRDGLPERPWEREERLAARYGLPPYHASVLGSHRMIADYFEEVAGRVGNPLAAGISVKCPVTAAFAAQIVAMLEGGRVTGSAAKTLLDISSATGEAPASVAEREDLGRMTNESSIEALCREVLEENPREARRCREGKAALLQFFIGRAMQKSRGKADPALVKRIFERLLIS
jgi:aspartyl-tRNA(Asn)/glutamyl-tRNA(Gln) amidotransferase subunit B